MGAIYLYARVSTKRQAESGQSIETQVEHGRDIARNQLGADPDDVFIDAPVSGSVELAERPDGGRVFDLLGDGDVLVASRLDRLYRDAVDGLLSTIELVERGTRIIVGDFGELNIDDPMRRFMFIQALAMAEYEKAKAVERTRDVKRSQANKNAYQGGYVPIGKEVIERDGKRVLVDDEVSEEMVTLILKLREQQGLSYRKIEAFLMENHGYTVSYKSIERILKACA